MAAVIVPVYLSLALSAMVATRAANPSTVPEVNFEATSAGSAAYAVANLSASKTS